jgi:chemotaxis protein histidine kinase CheA
VDLTEFLGEFQLEAGEKLDAIATQLLRLERDATNPQPIREMFLAAHTIKGGAAMMRLTDVEALAHALEDLLNSIRDQERTLDGTTADLLFQAIDRLRGLIALATSGSVGAEPDATLVAFATRLRSGSVEATPATRKQALVVDESATVRELHRLLLEDAGYDVDTCEDAAVAVSRAIAETFDLVVASLQHEGMNAFELCAALRPTGARVVLASTDGGLDLARKALECGAHALVRKGSLLDSELTRVLRDLD